MQRVDGGDIEFLAYGPGSYMQAEFRMGMDNVQVQGPRHIDNLFFYEKPNPVLGLGEELEGFDPENMLLRNRLGVLDGKNIGPVPPFFQFGFQCPYHGNHAVYLGGVTITENTDIHQISLAPYVPL
jgi:hypothetical protein